jgi:hypothetical protein
MPVQRYNHQSYGITLTSWVVLICVCRLHGRCLYYYFLVRSFENFISISFRRERMSLELNMRRQCNM